MAVAANNTQPANASLSTRSRTPPLAFPPPRTPRNNPLVLWHLLSLDAPAVAALWTWFIASANHVRLPLTSIAAMATAVWLLYAADRLLDSRATDTRHLEARHRFHHRHRRAFLTGIAAATLLLAALLPTLDAQAIHLYLIEGSFLIGYFVLIHATSSASRLPKELAVGPFFAAAIFIPTIARQPALRLTLLAPAMLFGTLCSLNCLFIYAWEHRKFQTDPATHLTTRIALRRLPSLAVALELGVAAQMLLGRHAPLRIATAVALSAILLLTLHHVRNAISATTLRASADLVLLTPLLFLPFQ